MARWSDGASSLGISRNPLSCDASSPRVQPYGMASVAVCAHPHPTLHAATHQLALCPLAHLLHLPSTTAVPLGPPQNLEQHASLEMPINSKVVLPGLTATFVACVIVL